MAASAENDLRRLLRGYGSCFGGGIVIAYIIIIHQVGQLCLFNIVNPIIRVCCINQAVSNNNFGLMSSG